MTGVVAVPPVSDTVNCRGLAFVHRRCITDGDGQIGGVVDTALTFAVGYGYGSIVRRTQVYCDVLAAFDQVCQ